MECKHRGKGLFKVDKIRYDLWLKGMAGQQADRWLALSVESP